MHTDFVFNSIGNLQRNPKFLTDNQHGSHKGMVLICSINTSLASKDNFNKLISTIKIHLCLAWSPMCKFHRVGYNSY